MPSEVVGLQMRLGRPWQCAVCGAWQEWCHKDYLCFQDRSAAFCGDSRAWH